MLEDLKLMDVSEISIHIGHLRRANLFIDPRGLKNWIGKLFEDVVRQIKYIIEISEKKNVVSKTQAIDRRVSLASTLPNKPSIMKQHDSSMIVSLPKSTKQIVNKCLDLFRLKNYARASEEIERTGLIMHQNDLNTFIDNLISEYPDLVESERQLLIDIKSLNLNENRIFYLDKVSEKDFSKITLFIFKRKYNGRFQVYLCATKKSHDLKKFSEILKTLFVLEFSKHTIEFIEEMKIISNKSLSKVFIISFLVEEMISHYDQLIRIDWEKEFKLYPNETSLSIQRPQINNMNENRSNTIIDNDLGNSSLHSKNNNNVIVKLPQGSQHVVEKCKELIEKYQPEKSNQIVKFEKNIIESTNMENFINVLFARNPHVTDNEKLNIHKLKSLNPNDSRSLFIETHNLESCVKIILFIVRLNSNGQFKIISCETKVFLRLFDITEIFNNFYRTKESEQTIELLQQLDALQSNKRINKSLIKYFVIEQFRAHFNDTIDIQWEQLVENKNLTSNSENRFKEDVSGPKSQEKAFENRTYMHNEQMGNRPMGKGYFNVINENQSNLEDLKKPLPLLKLPVDGKEFLEICEDFVHRNNMQPSYKHLQYNTANIKRAFVNKYIEKLLDDYFFANDHEKDSIAGMKNLLEGEKKCTFIEMSTHVSSKFVIILCMRTSNLKYQFLSCEDSKYHEVSSEFKNIFFEIYEDLTTREETMASDFLEKIKPMTNILNTKVFLLNYMIRNLNEKYKENVAIDWVSLTI